MKLGRTLQDLAKEVDRQNASKRDFVVSTAVVRMTTTSHLGKAEPNSSTLGFKTGNTTEMPIVSALAHDQIGTYLDIPSKFYDRLQGEYPDLFDYTINTLLSTRGDKRLVRTLDGHARAFLSDRYRRMDNFQLLAAIIPAFQERDDLHFASMEITDSRMYIKVLTDQLTAEVKKGDVVRAGVCVRNSEVGLGRLRVDPFVERLVCLNGMTIEEFGMQRNHAGKRVGADIEDADELFSDETMEADDRAFYLKVRDLVRATLSPKIFDKMVEQMRAAAGDKITIDPTKAVEEVADRYSLRDEERASVLRNLIEGADLSRWGMLNAVTATANNSENYDRASEIEMIGGKILTVPPQTWRAMAVHAQ